jgi:hypothetical protein
VRRLSSRQQQQQQVQPCQRVATNHSSSSGVPLRGWLNAARGRPLTTAAVLNEGAVNRVGLERPWERACVLAALKQAACGTYRGGCTVVVLQECSAHSNASDMRIQLQLYGCSMDDGESAA